MVLFIVILSLAALLVILCLLPANTPPIKDKNGNTIAGSIASLEKVRLGNKEQWIFIRAADPASPVILFLHGGPGTSQMGLLRRYTRELEKHFVVVNWDQRGAGKSYPAIHPESDMNMGQFISDACEFTEILRKRFNQKKIYLAGHSWGSVIGVLVARKHPELFYAYIGIGQVAHMKEGEKISYLWTLEQAEKTNHRATVSNLREMGIPPYSGDWQKKFMKQRRYLGKYGGEVYGNSMGAFPLVFGSLICATEYTLRDRVNFFRGIFSSVRLLWPELMAVDLNDLAPSLKIPVYFLLGKHDLEAPYMVAEQYFKKLEAPRKELIWFENSAHMLYIEENAKFNDLLINHILPETYIQ